MSLVEKTLFVVEQTLGERINLDALAAKVGRTPYHLSRVFAGATGTSLVRHHRDRRLSEAAKRLADGATDVLDVALNAGFESHEAFSRAFRARFGTSPSAVRAAGHTRDLELTEPITMNSQNNLKPEPVDFETRPAMKLVGLSRRFTEDTMKTVPALWQELVPWMGRLPGEVAGPTYGVSYDFKDGGFSYFCGAETRDPADVPPELTVLDVPKQFCAIFEHHGHISGFQETFKAVWSHYFAHAEVKAVEGYELEIYDERFNLDSDKSVVAIAVPVDPKSVPVG